MLQFIGLSLAAHLLLFGAVGIASRLLFSPPLATTDIEWQGVVSLPGQAGAPAVQKQPALPRGGKAVKYKLNLSQTVSLDAAPDDAIESGTDSPSTGSATSTGGSGGAVSAYRVTKLPQVIREVKAEYPPEAKKLGREARVLLAVVVDKDGTVSDARIIQGAGLGFDERALAAIRQFRFTPAQLGEKPVTVEIRYTYVFTLR